MDPGDGVTGERAAFERVAGALLHRRDVLAGDGAAHDRVLELERRIVVGRDLDPDVAVLASSPGLAHVASLGPHRVADRLPIGDAGIADDGAHLELPEQAVHQDLEVELPHPADDRLGGLEIGRDPERGVFVGELAQRNGQQLLVRLGPGFDHAGNDRLRELHGLEHDRGGGVADRLAGRGVAEADGGGDIAGVHLPDLLALVGMHLEEPADPGAAPADRVQDGVAGAQDPGINTEEGELPHVGIGHHLEDERGERRIVPRLPDDEILGDGRLAGRGPVRRDPHLRVEPGDDG